MTDHKPLAEIYDVALLDLDGVVYRGPDAVPGARDGIAAAREHGMRIAFVTNNSSRTPEAVASQLGGLGIEAHPDDVITSAQAAAALARARLGRGARVLVVGGDGLRTAVREAHLVAVESADDRPDAVLQGYSADLRYADLVEAALAVRGGALWIATNGDVTLPAPRGLLPGNGALVAAVAAATSATPLFAGKPELPLHEEAVRRTKAQRPLVVGDRLDTDLAGARAGGYPGLHVLTGVSSARDAVLAVPEQRPHLIGADLRALHAPHPEPVLEAGWWRCGTAAARVEAGALELDGSGIDLVRAACAAAWHATDEGGSVDPATVPELIAEDD